mmetsp:Transcript_23972/g.60998  ORF Transcript_23972/g.60998 Transcript_23972/m.60998 type:complete len:498 (-) Transcript_23972:178-1671(-)
MQQQAGGDDSARTESANFADSDYKGLSETDGLVDANSQGLLPRGLGLQPTSQLLNQSLVQLVVPRALAFVAGALCVGLALALGIAGDQELNREHNVATAYETDAMTDAMTERYEEWKKPSDKKRAYVMMAYDKPGTSQDYLYGALALARSLQRLSAYPTVLLTNTTHFEDGTDVKMAFETLGVQVRPLEKVEMHGTPGWTKNTEAPSPKWATAWWKLQIWKLTEYDQLIWLDADTALYRSMDWLFERKGMWSQADNWFCKEDHIENACTGILSLEPNLTDYHGLLAHAREVLPDLTRGDQELIQSYFKKEQRNVQVLSPLEAGFGQCLGQAKTPYLNADRTAVRGAWSTQAFVHKSGGWGYGRHEYGNVCFLPNITLARYRVGESTVNICQFHALGSYWRGLFCEAVNKVKLQVPALSMFCDNDCYFHGGKGDAPCDAAVAAMRGSVPAQCKGQDKGLTCGGPVNGTVSPNDYYNRKKGMPVFESVPEPGAKNISKA